MAAGTAKGQSSFAGAGKFTAVGDLPAQFGFESFAGSGLLTTGATLQEVAGENFAGAGLLIAGPTIPLLVGANYAGAGLFTVSGGIAAGQAIFAGAGSLTEQITLLESAAATFTPAGGFAATGVPQQFTTAQYNGAALFTAGAVELEQIGAVFAGSGLFAEGASLRLPASSNLAGAGTFIAAPGGGAAPQQFATASFAATGAFVPAAVLTLPAASSFAGSGLLAAAPDVVSGRVHFGQAVFAGQASFIVNSFVAKAHYPIANGRWCLVLPPVDALLIGLRPSRPVLNPQLNEEGFTLYYPAVIDGFGETNIVLRAPSGVLKRTQNFYEITDTALVPPGFFVTIAHVTALDELDETGLWEMYVENARGDRITDSGFFSVGVLN